MGSLMRPVIQLIIRSSSYCFLPTVQMGSFCLCIDWSKSTVDQSEPTDELQAIRLWANSISVHEGAPVLREHGFYRPDTE